MKTILYYAGYSSTNVGNMFYSEGVKYLLRELGEEKFRVITTSDLPGYYWQSFCDKPMLNYSELFLEYGNIDYLVLAGPMLNQKSLMMWEKNFALMRDKNIKVILISAGGSTYDKDEVDYVKGFLEKYKLYALLSRDSMAYNLYSIFFEKSYDGICCAFFIPEWFEPYNYSGIEYIVSCFETYKEPEYVYLNGRYQIADGWKIKKRKWELNSKSLFNPSRREKIRVKGRDVDIVRTKHTCMFEHRYKEENVFISDVGEDYLNIYANAECVFTDRVHACVATLAQGGQARLITNSPRAFLLDRVGAKMAKERVYSLDMSYIEEERRAMKIELKNIIE